MDLTIGQEYDALREEVRSFLAKHKDEALSSELGSSSEPGGYQKMIAWQAILVESGFVGRTIPKEQGGFGAEPNLLESIVIAEEFREAGVSLGMASQGISMFVPTLLQFGNEDQKKKYIGPTLKGEMIWCQGYSEPGSGSDLASLQTRAHLDGDEYVINGQKIWTSGAKESDMMFALVRTEPDAKKHAGISYIVLPVDTPGVEVRPLKQMNGQSQFNEVFFTDARVPRQNLVGEPGQGWAVGTYTLKHERDMLGRPGQSETYFDDCVSVLRDTGLLDNALYRDRLMKLQATLLGMKFHNLRVLTDSLKQRDPGISRLVTKLNGCQLNYEICGLAIDALGERGLLKPGSKHVRDQGAWQTTFMYALGLIIGGGTAQIQKNIISEVGLGMPREPKAVIPAR